MAERPFIIGIAGGSSSGKTTVTERLAALTGPEHLSLLELDSYYLDLGDAPIEERRSVNYDHPDAFDWALLNDHLAALANGASVPVPVYDYAAHNRSDRVRTVRRRNRGGADGAGGRCCCRGGGQAAQVEGGGSGSTARAMSAGNGVERGLRASAGTLN